jgi:hypothetical protein
MVTLETVAILKHSNLIFIAIMSMVAILKMINPKCTSTHPKDHSCEVSMISDHKKSP